MAKGICSVDGCEKEHLARGLCTNHYAQLRRRGPLPPRPTESERFWSKVHKTDECWIWTGALRNGYGVFNVGGRAGRAIEAHRWVTNAPQGMDVDHICRNRPCVRPDHLRIATRMQNVQNHSGEAQANNLSSGRRNVTWHKRARKWMVNVGHNHRYYYGGLFTDLDEADAKAHQMRLALHTHNDVDRI